MREGPVPVANVGAGCGHNGGDGFRAEPAYTENAMAQIGDEDVDEVAEAAYDTELRHFMSK